ncbi:MAG: Eco57I restriction-modification methylase domain-containing protein [Bacteroidetes bacterium]|nr:Eco57I restriction-modification methylase domain-containing protein [Bacteroidota bacterium]
MSFQLQLPMPEPAFVPDSYSRAGAAERGAVFTKESVVELILDLTGYVASKPLLSFRLLEPSFGEGDFLVIAADRLLQAYTREEKNDLRALTKCIRAVEVHHESIEVAKRRLKELFWSYSYAGKDVDDVISSWLIHGDFLLIDLPLQFTHVVGNPPYLRQESIPVELLREYRSRYRTMYDRADLYVPFIERGLCELLPEGRLGYICSDRWMKNRYGQTLRQLVSSGFHLEYYIDMVGTDAFHSEVSAYPAITVIANTKGDGITRIAHRPDTSRISLERLRFELQDPERAVRERTQIAENVVNGAQPWLLDSSHDRQLLQHLESRFPAIEDAGCRVGIGVATGADKIYIVRKENVEIERDRLLPLVRTRDIVTGTINWKGDYVINPFDEEGNLVRLEEYPGLSDYLISHQAHLRKRNCAQRQPKRWYRTIDRIHPTLVREPKLLIPDIKEKAHIVYDSGRYYPHHNLYYVVAKEWDLRALQTVLRSPISTLFISTYSTQMRGGYLRFQAQYLRRIRIPLWKDVSTRTRQILIDSAESGNDPKVREIIARLYGLSREQEGNLYRMFEGMTG